MRRGVLLLTRIGVLGGACGALVWHVMDWQAAGVYSEMLRWNERGMGHLAGLYSLALMLASGFVLAFLLECVSNLIGSRDRAASVCGGDPVRDETCST